MVPMFFVPETSTGRGEALPLLPALRKVVVMPRARAAILSLAGLAAVLALLEPLLPLDLDERLGLSPFAIGLVFSAGLLAYFAMVPLAGSWSDRRGRRLPTLVGGVVMALALPLTAVGPAWSVAIAFAVVGAGMAALGASSGALMVEAVNEAGMEGRYGLSSALLTIVFAAGYAFGPLAGGRGQRDPAVPRDHHDRRARRRWRWSPGSAASSRATMRERRLWPTGQREAEPLTDTVGAPDCARERGGWPGGPTVHRL